MMKESENKNEKNFDNVLSFPSKEERENIRLRKFYEQDVAKGVSMDGPPTTRSVFDKYYEQDNVASADNDKLKYLKSLCGDRKLTPSSYLDICKKVLIKHQYQNVLIAIMDNEYYNEMKNSEDAELCGVVDSYFEIMSPSKKY